MAADSSESGLTGIGSSTSELFGDPQVGTWAAHESARPSGTFLLEELLSNRMFHRNEHDHSRCSDDPLGRRSRITSAFGHAIKPDLG
jgi:hypothetical protein